MKKLVMLSLLLALAGVWGGSTAQATVTLTLAPSASAVALGGTLTLTATVTGTTTLGLNWYVNGVQNGSATQGTLTACTTTAPLTCKYTAPSVDVPNPNPVTFKIVSQADGVTSKTTTATVTDSIAVTLSPTSESLALSGTQVFTATTTGTNGNAALNWYVNGVLNGSAAQGTLTACTTTAPLTCKYTVPPVDVPSPNPALIKVSSAADPGKYKTSKVTVTDPIAVTLSPTSESLALSGTQVFTATITGTNGNAALNWYVNGVLNGSAAQGTLTACTTTAPLTCKYTAPPIDVPSPNPAVVKVASSADPGKYKTANVIVTDPIAVTLSPTSESLALSGTQGFTATITGTNGNAALNWYVNGVLNGSAAQGTLTACTTVAPLTCKYTAPPIDVPSPNPAVIKVASNADPGKYKTAKVTVTDPIAVTLSPTSESLALSGTQVFTATITGTNGNAALNWYVNGVLNGSAAQGTLTACTTTAPLTCTYTAPPIDVPSPNPAVVKVASNADPGKNKMANVTVTDPIAVTLSPASESVELSGKQVFTATISGTTNTALDWSVNGVKNGNSTQGTLTACTTSAPWECTYTAPPIDVPNPNPAAIEVASAADSSKNKAAVLTVTDSIAVTLSPASKTLAPGGTEMFTATISGTTNTGLTWYVNGMKNGNSTQGTLTACTTSAPWECTYTAPSSEMPSPNPAVIMVASAADPGKYKTADVTVSTPALACTDKGSESLLIGQYAFSLSGYNSTGYLGVVGSFTADGTGKITAGEVDSIGALGLQSKVSIDTSQSSYSVGSSHLGCATIVTSFGTFNTRLAVGGIISIAGTSSNIATAGRMVEWDAPTSGTYFAGTGQILQQTAPSAALSGKYVFATSGTDGSGVRQAMAGVMTASGGSFSSGEMDWNDGGTSSNGTGLAATYTSSDSYGRFTYTYTEPAGLSGIGTVGYKVSGAQMLLVAGANASPSVGQMQLQTPPTGGFGAGSVDGNMVVYWTGLNGGGTGGSAQIGLVSGTGNGSMNVTTYEDDAGKWKTPNPGTSTCGYSIDSSGRMTFTSGSCEGALYLTAANTAFLLTPGSTVGFGQVVPQVVPSGGFTSSSFSGTYYFGDTEVVSYGLASAEQIGVTILTITSGSPTLIQDFTSTTGGQQADETQSGGTLSVNSNGTFEAGDKGYINAIMISTTEFVSIDNSGETYPTLLVGQK